MFKKLRFLTDSEVIRSSVNAFIEEWYNDSNYIIAQTSGSTGQVKNIQLSKKHMCISAQKTIDHFKLKKGGSSFLCLSVDTIGGKMMIVRSIINEMELLVGDIRTHSLEEIKNLEIDLAAIVPLQLAYSLEQHLETIKKIKVLLVGGGPISKKIEEQMILNNCSAYHTYGMTETVSHVALRKIGIDNEKYYTALRDVSFSTFEEKLVIHFPEIGLENLQTNDLVNLIDNQSFEFIGRADFIINSGGKKFNPEIIESLISPVINVPFFIGSVDDDLLGNRIVLFLESSVKIDEGKLIDEIKNMLPEHAVPRRIVCLTQFIRTESGKINRLETNKLII
jgi:O-succinylbenzoic acid--CoA ligase